jgi:hypothetical protein
MSLSSDTARIQYTVTTSPQNFAVPFYILASSDIQVILTVDGVDATLTLNTDYTVSGAGTNPSTASVNSIEDSVGATLTIVRSTMATQPATFIQNGQFPTSTVEQCYDRLTMLVQRLVVDVQRCLRFASTNAAAALMALNSRKNKILGFDNDGAIQFMDPLGAASLTGTVIEVTSYSALRAVSVTSFATGRQARVTGKSSSGDGGEGSFYYNAVSSATDNDGTVIAAAVGRWIRLYSGPVNVKWFGAKGDGISDDSAALQAALDLGAPTGTPDTTTGGLAVIAPRGVYKANTGLTIQSLTTIIGEGIGATIFDFSGMSSGAALTPVALPTTTNRLRIEIQGVKFNGPGRTSSVDGFSQTGVASNIRFRSCWFINFRTCIRMTSITACSFSGLRCSESQRGLYIDAPGTLSTTTLVEDFYIDQCEQGAYLDRCQTFTFEGGVFENNIRATALTDGNVGVLMKGSLNCAFYNTHFEANPVDVRMDASASGALQCQANLFHNCMMNTASGGNSFELVSSRQAVIATCWPNQSGGVYIKIWNASQGNQVIQPPNVAVNFQYKNEADVVASYPAGGSNSFEIRSFLGTWHIRGGAFKGSHGSTSQAAFVADVDGDVANRYAVLCDGKTEWGDGTGARDTNLYRSAANTLKTDDALVTASLSTGAIAGSALTATGDVSGSSLIAVAGGQIQWSGRAKMDSPSSSSMRALNSTATGFSSVESLYERAGSGSPEGVVTAPIGARYSRTDGGAGTSLYVKESGVGNTGWVAK